MLSGQACFFETWGFQWAPADTSWKLGSLGFNWAAEHFAKTHTQCSHLQLRITVFRANCKCRKSKHIVHLNKGPPIILNKSWLIFCPLALFDAWTRRAILICNVILFPLWTVVRFRKVILNSYKQRYIFFLHVQEDFYVHHVIRIQNHQ